MKQKIILGGGCFWCTEAIFQNIKGVESVTSGYAGGYTDNPTYEQICTGNTGHAEVVLVEFDDDVICFGDLIRIFFTTHNPTTLNSQGYDTGTQYRSVIYCDNLNQLKMVHKIKSELQKTVFDEIIVTEIVLAKQLKYEFFEAENYHQNYYINNPHQGYCSTVINPKLQKLRKLFYDSLK